MRILINMLLTLLLGVAIISEARARTVFAIAQRDASKEGKNVVFAIEVVAAWQTFSANPNRATATALVEAAPTLASYFQQCSPGGSFFETERLLSRRR
jgi:hypothetical protein